MRTLIFVLVMLIAIGGALIFLAAHPELAGLLLLLLMAGGLMRKVRDAEFPRREPAKRLHGVERIPVMPRQVRR